MNAMNIIDGYVELSIKKDELKSTINNVDSAYEKPLEQNSQGINASSNEVTEPIDDVNYELDRINYLLNRSHQNYLFILSTMSKIQLSEIYNKIAIKIDEIQRFLEEIRIKRNFAISKGKIAREENNFAEEKIYSDISTDCFIESNKLKPSLKCYLSFLSDLEKRIAKADDVSILPVGRI